MDSIFFFVTLGFVLGGAGFLILLARACGGLKWPWGICVIAVIVLNALAWRCLVTAGDIAASC